jgi:hypothetical protein
MSEYLSDQLARLERPPLRVVAAAVRLVAPVDLGVVRAGDVLILSMPPPARHHTILHAMAACGIVETASGYNQGFLLSDGSYCEREAALVIATAAGQLVLHPDAGRSPIAPPNLFSEDMW